MKSPSVAVALSPGARATPSSKEARRILQKFSKYQKSVAPGRPTPSSKEAQRIKKNFPSPNPDDRLREAQAIFNKF